MDGYETYPFQKLEQLMQDLSGSAKGGGANCSPNVKYPIRGQTFVHLGASFEDWQKRISIEMHEKQQEHQGGGASDLLIKLEEANKMVVKIRETSDEKLFRTFLDKEIKRRSDYRAYLELVNKGSSIIAEERKKYKVALKQRHKQLQQIVRDTETCDIPYEISSSAQSHS